MIIFDFYPNNPFFFLFYPPILFPFPSSHPLTPDPNPTRHPR